MDGIQRKKSELVCRFPLQVDPQERNGDQQTSNIESHESEGVNDYLEQR
jgi:hypothetical protein